MNEDLNILQEEINKKKQEQEITVQKQENTIANLTSETKFSQTIDNAKIEVLKEATISDGKFVNDFKKELKDATLKSAQLEKEKQQLEKQNIEYHQELLETQQKLNKQKQEEDKWSNKQKSRQFHFDGVADIMAFVGIKKPMCIPLLYVFVVCLIIPFFLCKFIKGTFGALIIGGENGVDRPKGVKAFLATLFAIFCLIAVALGVYLIINWLHPFGLLA